MTALHIQQQQRTFGTMNNKENSLVELNSLNHIKIWQDRETLPSELVLLPFFLDLDLRFFF